MSKQSSSFSGTEVFKRLTELKATGVASWWSPALNFFWNRAKATTKGSTTTKWVDVHYTDSAGVKAPLVFKVRGETHVGQIRPNTDAGVAELNAAAKNPSFQIEKRPGHPSIQVQKWNAKVDTEADGITLMTGADGKPILPSDDKLSPMYGIMALVGEAFAVECADRTARGEKLVETATAMKKADKNVTANSVINAVNPTGTFLTPEQVTALRRLFTQKADQDTLMAGAIVGKLTVISTAQEAISSNAKRNAGQLLPNPLARASLKFDTNGMPMQLSIHDMSQYSELNGRPHYEDAKVDGEPVNADNIHKFVLPRSTFDGIVKMDSVCFSQMGISMPTTFKVIVLRQPAVAADSALDDLYGDDLFTAPIASTQAAVSTQAPVSAAAAAAPVVSNSEYDDLLKELGGDQ